MIKVQKHGNARIIINPADPKQTTEEVPVTFIEEGRGGLNTNLTQSANLLSEFAGAEVGLPQFRTHTFPVKIDLLDKFKLGTELPFFINRTLTSTPQMRQQENVEARMVDGKLTYVSTRLSRTMEADDDQRTSLEVMARINPEAVRKATTGTAIVKNAEPVVAEGPNVAHETLTQ